MPRLPRVQFADAYYHIFNRGVDKRIIFFDIHDRQTFLSILGRVVSEYHLKLFAYCLMDNHFHLFLQTALPNLDRSMQMLQGQYAQYINLRHARVGSLFQGRYKSRLVEKDSYSLSLVRYIHKNPVEAGAVAALEDYPWSSYLFYIGRSRAWDWLSTDWILRQFHDEDQRAKALFKEFHQLQVPKGSDPSGIFDVK